MQVFDFIFEHVCSFLSFFWSVFSFWALWQLCDYGLSRLKVRLTKPWDLAREKGAPYDEGHGKETQPKELV